MAVQPRRPEQEFCCGKKGPRVRSQSPEQDGIWAEKLLQKKKKKRWSDSTAAAAAALPHGSTRVRAHTRAHTTHTEVKVDGMKQTEVIFRIRAEFSPVNNKGNREVHVGIFTEFLWEKNTYL